MKVTVPMELDINLQPTQIIFYVRDWIIPLLKRYETQGSDYPDSRAFVKDDKIYWYYTDSDEVKLKEIEIEDPLVFNLCRSGVQFLMAYQSILDVQELNKNLNN